MENTMVLWEQEQCAAWEAALAAYPAAVEARGGPKLLALDRWVHDELPGEVRAREPRHLKHDELLRVVRWKMGRGVWRANNLQLAASNAPEDVQAYTAEALALVGAVPVPMVVQAGARAGETVAWDGAPVVSTVGAPASGATTSAALLAPVRVLAKLRGIGPATVSAVLAAVYP